MKFRTKSNTKVTQALEALNYDFGAFELNHFLEHIGRLRGREIVCHGFPFKEKLFGVWIPRDTRDYIAYNSSTYEIHHTHIILHEVGHMILNHQPVNLETVFGSETVQLLEIFSTGTHLDSSSCIVLPRTVEEAYICSNPQEAEAEEFAALVQNHVFRANRFQYLVQTSTTINELRAFTDALGFQE